MAKKHFPCGHFGKGQYCHECERLRKENEQEKIVEAEKRDAKIAHEEKVCAASIDLDGLPEKIQSRILTLLAEIASGTNVKDLPHAKRLTKSGRRDLVSVKIGDHYRLVIRENLTTGKLTPEWAGSHENYNTRYSKVLPGNQ